MKLTKEYMDTLLAKKVIPQDSWNHEIINNKTCTTIKNMTHAHLFWLDLWLNLIGPMFKSQQMIQTIEKIDMNRPVIITENLELIGCDPIINNIEYFSSIALPKSKNPFLINISIGQIFITYIILVIFISLLSLCVQSIFENVNIFLL